MNDSWQRGKGHLTKIKGRQRDLEKKLTFGLIHVKYWKWGDTHAQSWGIGAIYFMHYLGRRYEFSIVLTISAFLHGSTQEEYIYTGFCTDITYILHTSSDRLNSERRVIFQILFIAFIL